MEWDQIEEYNIAEQKVDKITKFVLYTFFITVQGCFCVPFGVVGFHYINGTYTPDAWMLPMEIR